MIENSSSQPKCKDLLQDTSFLLWKFFPTAELEQRWSARIEQNPLLAAEVQKAEKYLKERYYNQHALLPNEEKLLLDRIIESVKKQPKKKTGKILPWITYAVASCLLALITVGVYQYTKRTTPIDEIAELVVGNALQSEDIQLITNNKVTSFEENIDVIVSENGEVKVKDGAGEELTSDKGKTNKLIVPYGKRSKIVLSDGTQVWLNSGSTIEFPSQFPKNSREIRLDSGEIYIEVSPDKNRRFLVQTADFKVRVLGTKFNISSYSNSPKSVVLVEGSVGLASGKSELKLQPDYQATLTQNGAFSTKKVDVNEFTSWKNGYLLFQNTPISDVLKQIERYYNLSFSVVDEVCIKERRCSGKLHLSENVDDIMNTIARLSSTQYKREGNTISISATHKSNKH